MSHTPRVGSGYVGMLLLVLGLAGLTEGLRWYWRHLERLSAPSKVAKAAPTQRPIPTPRTLPTPRPVPTPEPPSAEELAGLCSSDLPTQWASAEALLKRQMTPDLAEAVGRCRAANEPLARKFDCLRARVPGASLDGIVAQLPAADDAVWPPDVDHCVCLLEVLARRIEEDPDRIARAIFPFALSYPMRPREPALAGLSKVRFERLPAWAAERIDQAWNPGLAVMAAFALRIEELDPDYVERWAFDADRSARHNARHWLASSPSPLAASLLARLVVRHREDKDLLGRLGSRERERHDAATQLVRIALDESEAHETRLSALEVLSQYGGKGHVPPLAPLRSGSDGALRAYAEAAISTLEKRR